MKAQTKIHTVIPAATTAMVLGMKQPDMPAIRRDAVPSSGLKPSGEQDKPRPAEIFRREMARRYKAPCRLFWDGED